MSASAFAACCAAVTDRVLGSWSVTARPRGQRHALVRRGASGA
ncbi:hypothetical protein [Streptomyces capparidis]